MKLFGWIIIFLLGYTLVCLISKKLKSSEKLAFSLPLGMGLNSLLMALLDVSGAKVNDLSNLFLIHFSFIIVLVIVAWRLKMLDSYKITISEKFSLFPINLGWAFMICLIGYVIVNVIDFAMLWPVNAYDSVAGYDFMAKAIVQEGTLNNSIFESGNSLATIRSFYPPVGPHNYAYAYMLGYENSKIVQMLLLVSFCVGFYLLMNRYTTHLASALFTFLIVITPQLIKYFALSSTNALCAGYASLGFLSIFIWYDKDDDGFFHLGTILLAFALWSRTEAIVFAASAGVLVFIKSVKGKGWMKLVEYTAVCGLMFVSWQYFVRVELADVYMDPGLGSAASSPGKWGRMFGLVDEVLFSTGKYWGEPGRNNYGVIPELFLFAILINVYFIYKEKDKVGLLVSIFLAFFLYMGVLYVIDTDYKDEKMSGYIYAGFRRGFISFIPVLIFYIGINKVSLTLFKKYLRID